MIEYQRRIGITGGIASGKSSVGRFLYEVKGLPILDADIYAREELENNTDCIDKILRRYSHKENISIRNQPLKINREKLAEIIFHDIKERKWLEELIHPNVRIRLESELKKHQDKPIVILVIPLLFEAKFEDLCNEVWVIYCEIEQQYERLMARNKIDRHKAKKIIESQFSIKEKARRANIIIDNRGMMNSWINEIEKYI
tara:strand:+ start:405 stop:1004 length:600 start_codon:yes stop_codon:yes gene_type:complete